MVVGGVGARALDQQHGAVGIARQRFDREAGHGFEVRLALRAPVAVVLVLHVAQLEQAEHGGFAARVLELAGVVDECARGVERLPLGDQVAAVLALAADAGHRSEDHTSELQSLMRTSYAVFCWTKKNKSKTHYTRS